MKRPACLNHRNGDHPRRSHHDGSSSMIATHGPGLGQERTGAEPKTMMMMMMKVGELS